MNVDTHFHIFDKNLLDKSQSRYLVDCNASIEDWSKAANDQQITGGVIVQPSFLGFDNSLLLETIKQNPKYLRGVGAVDPKTSRKEMLELNKQGIRGIRLNLFGNEDPFGTLEKYQDLISLLKGLNMHVQIHHDDGLLNKLLLCIPKGVIIVIDHFGRPKTNDEFEKFNDGINRHQEYLWVKLSAQYRTSSINHQAIFKYWLAKIGVSRLLWGSDWPHTRFENFELYEVQMKRYFALVDDLDLRVQILSTNPRSLYWV